LLIIAIFNDTLMIEWVDKHEGFMLGLGDESVT